MSLISNYKYIPVSGRFGQGCYTYKCVLDTEETGVTKIDIFADSVELAINIVALQFGAVLSYSYVSDNVISLILAPYSSGSCLLYLD